MNNAVIAGYVRSPFHFAHKGALVEKRPDDLAAEVVHGLIDQTGVDPAEIEDLIIGCAFPEGEAGLQPGPHRGAHRGPAGLGRRRHRQPLLRLVDAGDPHRRRRDPHGCRGRRSSAPASNP